MVTRARKACRNVRLHISSQVRMLSGFRWDYPEGRCPGSIPPVSSRLEAARFARASVSGGFLAHVTTRLFQQNGPFPHVMGFQQRVFRIIHYQVLSALSLSFRLFSATTLRNFRPYVKISASPKNARLSFEALNSTKWIPEGI